MSYAHAEGGGVYSSDYTFWMNSFPSWGIRAPGVPFGCFLVASTMLGAGGCATCGPWEDLVVDTSAVSDPSAAVARLWE